MKINVRLIGRYKDIAAKEIIQLDVKKGDTLWHIVDAFVTLYPLTEKDKKIMMVCKNKMFASYDTVIENGDEITLAPPVVSGG